MSSPGFRGVGGTLRKAPTWQEDKEGYFMSIVHSYAVGNGDMFSIRHNSDNCTIIDCSISEDNKDWLLREIDNQQNCKGVVRFISTHPDQDPENAQHGAL